MWLQCQMVGHRAIMDEMLCAQWNAPEAGKTLAEPRNRFFYDKGNNWCLSHKVVVHDLDYLKSCYIPFCWLYAGMAMAMAGQMKDKGTYNAPNSAQN